MPRSRVTCGKICATHFRGCDSQSETGVTIRQIPTAKNQRYLPLTRRDFLGRIESAARRRCSRPRGQRVGTGARERPIQAADVVVLNPATRVPLSFIIDDSTCLVNLNRFAMPQFDTAFGGQEQGLRARLARSWPRGDPRQPSCASSASGAPSTGSRANTRSSRTRPASGGSIASCPGWTPARARRQHRACAHADVPIWDIHPEMVTHTRVIDTKTGHPYRRSSTRFMENSEWTTDGRADEIAAYHRLRAAHPAEHRAALRGRHHARRIRRPGAPAVVASRRCRPCGTSTRGDPSLLPACCRTAAPRASRRASSTRRISTAPIRVASSASSRCTGDWTGGWDNTPPGGVDRFITADLQGGSHGRCDRARRAGGDAVRTGPGIY